MQSSGHSTPEIADELKITEARVFKLLGGSLYYSSLEAMAEEDGEHAPEQIQDTTLPVHRLVYLKICIELMEEEFQKLSFKERELLGGPYGVFGHEERTLADLGEQFQLKENAALKARDKALNKLAGNCLTGKLGIWKDVYRAVMECARYT